ncbi:endonuclease/exonuclease/phosphatase family protein [Mycobacterium sp. 1274761.0]|uniref:endonuclease/exonuclease/phosphatase family protein n=1 Tax=Mycobacterium sp. 1274761.0 TaxID=1834077 RepID=UPI0007FBE3AB|nr:endonuclease/exonuclease/phosphatase family protein [Mycobacterium sp. 1274761.0]OBK74365.1 endonuclease [Mycobacterium sp. 1274761.0]
MACDELTLTTYNIWNDSAYDKERYLAIAQLLSRRSPDVMVFQEVTSTASDVLLSQDWIRASYSCAAVVGGEAGDYGLLLLSRLPVSRVAYARLPWSDSRGFLQAELPLNGATTVVCCLHLDSGKASARLRGWQLRRIFRALRDADEAVVLGDFNMRDAENGRIGAPYRDVWPMLRPDEGGFTEDTSANLMLGDLKNKPRHVRFDRVLLKGDQWRADAIELLGTEPIADDLPRVFPSDHFGLECRLTRRNP